MHPCKGTTGQSGTLLLIVLCAMTALICCGSDNPAKAGGPVITVQPQPQTVNEGDSVVLSVTATGNDLDYQWQVDTVDIPGAFEPSYVIDSATAGCAGTYRVIVANSQGTVISNSVKLTVKPWVRFSLSRQSAMENEGSITVTAELSSACDTAVSVPFIVSGTALRGTDYTISSSPLTIPKDSLSAAITIAITDDSLYENDETVIVTMGAPVNAARGNTTVDTVTILNDDPMPSIPTVQFTQAGQSASEGAGTMAITVQLSRSYYLPVTVPFTVSGTALQSTDYTITPSPLTIPADSLSARIVITVIDDNEIENDESVVVTLGTPTNATRGTISIHTATIIDNDTTAIYAVEGNHLILITPKSITSYCSGSTLHADTMRVSRDTLQFSLSNDTLRLTINGTVDTLTLVRVGAGSGIQGQWRMTNVSYETIIEFGPSTFTTSICNADVFMQSQAPSLEANYYIAAARLSCNSVLLTGNSTGEKVTITYTPLPNNPFGIYADETYSSDNPLHSPPGTVYANPASCPNTAPAWYTTFLTENMTAPTVRFTGGSQIVSEGAGTVTVTARLSAHSALPVTVPFSIIRFGNSATPDSDYTISPSPLIIPPDSLSATIKVSIIDDSIVEDSENVIIGMGTPINAVAGDTILHIIIIVDNEPPWPIVQFTSASQSAAEGAGTMTVRAQLSGAYFLPVTVPFTVSGTALRDSDYTITPSPIVIPAGSLSAAITITMIDDTVFEKNETVVVTMGTPVNAKRGTTTVHTATITNDDPSPYYGTFSFLNPLGSSIWYAVKDYAVQWQTTGSPGQNAALELYRDTAFYSSITPTTPAGTGSFTWNIPDAIASGSGWRIKISSTDDPALYAFSDSFTIIGRNDAYEYDNKRDSAKTAELDAVQLHTMYANDTDWVKFTAESGSTYVFSVITGASDTTMLYFYLYFGTETSYTYAALSDWNGAFTYTWQCTRSGTWYVRMTPFNDNQHFGGYSFRMIKMDPAANTFFTPAAGAVLTMGTSSPVTWTAETAIFSDSVSLYLYKGGRYYTGITATLNDGSFDWTPAQGVATGSDYTLRLSNTTYPPICFFGPQITINGWDPDVYENDNTRALAKTAAPGDTQLHTITIHDTDWVKFTLDSGSTYTISFTPGAHGTNPTRVDLWLYYGTETSSTYYTTASDSGVINYTWTCTRSGTWYVRMIHDDNWFGYTYYGEYFFTVTKL